jgi:SRSO17 transposase
MDGQAIGELAQGLGRFLGGFYACFTNRRAFDNFRAYCEGLVGELPRKSVEPIAHHTGKGVRALQCFLTQGPWDHQRMRDQLQQHVAERHAPVPGEEREPSDLAIGTLDETSDLKHGPKTPGAQRQYLGCRGKKDNGIVTVHLGFHRQDFSSLIDGELFLPESWAEDRPRRREAGIPDEMSHRSKPTMALEQIDRALSNGLVFDFFTFDALYGRSNPFLRGLEQRGQFYVGEVPSDFRCYGRRPKYNSPQKPFAPKQVRDLCRHSPIFRDQAWHTVRIGQQTRPAQPWRVKAGRVPLQREDGTPTDRHYWLLVAHQRETGQWKYFVSNAPAHTAQKTLLRVAFSRWEIEHQFRTAKSELGFFDYEGRDYTGLTRHLTLCQLVMCFAAEQRAARCDFFP